MRPSAPTRRGGFQSPADLSALLALSAVWGCTFLFIEVAVRVVSPLWIVASRTLLGASVLLVVLALRRIALPRGAGLWGHLVFLSVPGNVIPWTMVAWAQQSVPSGLTAVLYALMPLTTYLASAVVRIESLTPRRAVGLVVALAGTAVVVWPRMGVPHEMAGVLAILGATLLLSAGAVYAKRFVSHRVRPLPMAAGQLLVGTLVSFVAAVSLSRPPRAAELTIAPVLALVALGLLSTGMAFVVYYWLIDRVGATNATFVSYLIPVVGLLAGWLVLAEEVSVTLLVGAVVIVAGIALSSVRRATAPVAPRASGP
jgi:drug/metabolite transporter (DMT)-like permease